MYGALSSAEFAISIWPMMADISQKQILKKKKRDQVQNFVKHNTEFLTIY